MAVVNVLVLADHVPPDRVGPGIVVLEAGQWLHPVMVAMIVMESAVLGV